MHELNNILGELQRMGTLLDAQLSHEWCTPERGPRTLPIEKTKRPYWICNAMLKRIYKSPRSWKRDRQWAYGELQLRKRYRRANR